MKPEMGHGATHVYNGSGLADQRPDQVAIVNDAVALALLPRHHCLGIAPRDLLGIQPDVHRLPDQPRGHGIEIEADPNRREPTNQNGPGPALLQLRGGQSPHRVHVLLELLVSTAIPADHEVPQERRIVRLTRQVASPAEQQRLRDGPVEAVRGLFHIAVLMAASGGVRLGLYPLMVQDLAIAGCEGQATCPQRMRGSHQIFRAMDGRDTPQLPEGGMKPGDQRLEALRGTDRTGLPVRVGQDEMIEGRAQKPGVTFLGEYVAGETSIRS